MRSLIRICSSVFLTVALMATGYADEHFPFLAVVSKASVNIRAGGNTNFERIGQLKEGDQVVVVAKAFDWYKVQLPSSAKAYVRVDYLKSLSSSISEMIGDNVNIRAAANSESAASLGFLKKGELVKVVAIDKGWAQIEPPPQATGWIRQDFLSLKSETVDPALIRKPLTFKDEPSAPKTNNAPEQKAAVTLTSVQGRLVPLNFPKTDVRYEIIVNGKSAYYVQSVPSIDRFNGAMVSIQGVVSQDASSVHPLLHIVNISLLL